MSLAGRYIVLLGVLQECTCRRCRIESEMKTKQTKKEERTEDRISAYQFDLLETLCNWVFTQIPPRIGCCDRYALAVKLNPRLPIS